MITYNDVLARAKLKSDINEHLTFLYNLTVDLPLKEKVVVELGVRNGESTTALLAAVNDSGGHLFSVDTEDCINARMRLRDEPNWSFMKEDDMELVKKWCKPIDHLFIDTSHSLSHTIAELRQWGKWVKIYGLISLHDTEAPKYSGVMQAIKYYIYDNPSFSFKNYPHCYGLGVIKKLPDARKRK